MLEWKEEEREKRNNEINCWPIYYLSWDGLTIPLNLITHAFSIHLSTNVKLSLRTFVYFHFSFLAGIAQAHETVQCCNIYRKKKNGVCSKEGCNRLGDLQRTQPRLRRLQATPLLQPSLVQGLCIFFSKLINLHARLFSTLEYCRIYQKKGFC